MAIPWLQKGLNELGGLFRLVLSSSATLARKLLSALVRFPLAIVGWIRPLVQWSLDLFRQLQPKLMAFIRRLGKLVRAIARIIIWTTSLGAVLLLALLHPLLRAVVFTPLFILIPYWLAAGAVYRMAYGERLSGRLIWDSLRTKSKAAAKRLLRTTLWYAIFFAMISIMFLMIVITPVVFSGAMLGTPDKSDYATSLFALSLHYYVVAAGCLVTGVMFYTLVILLHYFLAFKTACWGG